MSGREKLRVLWNALSKWSAKLAALAVARIKVAGSIAQSYLQKLKRKIQHGLLCIIWVVKGPRFRFYGSMSLFILSICAFAYVFVLPKGCQNPLDENCNLEPVISSIAILFTGLLATIGWNFGAYGTRRTEAQNHTLKMISEVLHDHDRRKIRGRIERYIPKGSKIGPKEFPHELLQKAISTTPDFSNFDNPSITQLIIFYLDGWEWIAQRIESHIADEKLYKNMVGVQFIQTCDTYCYIISYYNDINPFYYKYINSLYWRWSGRPLRDVVTVQLQEVGVDAAGPVSPTD